MRKQKVNISEAKAPCIHCGVDLLDISNVKYTGNALMAPRYREEFCLCRSCGTEFIIRYDIFDKEGHVEQRVFTGDVNNPDYNWQDNLSESQLGLISEHLVKCEICQARLTEESLNDAWFASIIHGARHHV